MSCRAASRISIRFRRLIAVAVLLLVSGLIVPAARAGAEPFTMNGIPPQIPRAIDGTVPAPPYPHLSRIPQRAVAPGFRVAAAGTA